MSEEKTKPSLDDLKLSENVLNLRKALVKELKVGDGGVISVSKDTVEAVVGAESLKSVADAQKVIADLAAATALAVTDLSVPYLKKNKDVSRVELMMPVAKDKIEATFDRTKTSRNPLNGGEPVTRFGVLNMSYTANGAVNQRGVVKKIRSYASQLADYELNK